MSADETAEATGSSAEAGGNAVLLNQPIVIDNGTATTKAGFAGGSRPKVGADSCTMVELPYLLRKDASVHWPSACHNIKVFRKRKKIPTLSNVELYS